MTYMKIIQIIPAPAWLLLRYKGAHDEVERCKPLCLALVEHEDGDTGIELVDIDSVGCISFAKDACNFDGIDWNNRRMTDDPSQSFPKSQALGILPQKKAAPGAANTQDGEQTQHSS